ncbi:MAG: hypothetical protein HQ564_09430 [Candidatus Saganbacteria bacterium]|nr:hypothetical protein [Candidatus Saganbacteria bacterium]
MDFKETLEIERYKAALKAAEDCRKRELTMMNFSIIVFGAVFAFAVRLTGRPALSFFSLMFLWIFLSLIGIYIAKLNSLEQYHFRLEKDFYGVYGINKRQYKHTSHLNKIILFVVYLLVIFIPFACSIKYIKGLNDYWFFEFSRINCYNYLVVFVAFLVFFICLFWKTIIPVFEKKEDGGRIMIKRVNVFSVNKYYRMTDAKLESEAKKWNIGNYAVDKGGITGVDREKIISQLIEKDKANNSIVAVLISVLALLLSIYAIFKR